MVNVSIAPETLQQLQKFISDNEHIMRRLPSIDNKIAQFMAGVCDMYVHKWSGGAYRTGNQGPSWTTPRRNTQTGRFQKQETINNHSYTASRAWSFPVPRITGDYYAGWKMEKAGPGTWRNYNETREAYFIEFGIHPSKNRVRRPVAKKSALDTLRAVWNTGVVKRFTDEAFREFMVTGIQSPGVMP